MVEGHMYLLSLLTFNRQFSIRILLYDIWIIHITKITLVLFVDRIKSSRVIVDLVLCQIESIVIVIKVSIQLIDLINSLMMFVADKRHIGRHVNGRTGHFVSGWVAEWFEATLKAVLEVMVLEYWIVLVPDANEVAEKDSN